MLKSIAKPIIAILKPRRAKSFPGREMEDKMSRLLVVDGNSVMHRAFHALPLLTSPDGQYTNAIHGFMSMLLKAMEEQRPDHVAVAFDMHGPTFRHEKYPEYKEGRRETPDELKPQFDMMRELLGAMGIAVFESEGHEADDILGTLAVEAAKAGIPAVLMTGDKDALQLVSPYTSVMLMRRGISDTDMYDEAALMERYGLSPDKMIDLKGLMGDSSDNIPGVPGVGEKTALKLLHRFDSLEGVLENSQQADGPKLRERLKEYADQARLSREIATIKTDTPLDKGVSDCAISALYTEASRAVLEKLGMRSILKRLESTAGQENDDKKEFECEEAIVINEEAALLELVKGAAKEAKMAFHMADSVFLAFESGKSYDISLSRTLIDDGLSRGEALLALKPLLENKNIYKVLLSDKDTRHALEEDGISLGGDCFDLALAAWLIDPAAGKYELNAICEKYLSIEASGAAMLLLEKELIAALEQHELKELYETLERPLTSVLFDMEKAGFGVDKAELLKLDERFSEDIASLQMDIYALAGHEFNIGSPKQLGVVLFEELGLPASKKTKSGYSTDVEVLEGLLDAHPIIQRVIDWRQVSKLKSTYISGLMPQKDGRVHTRFVQTVASTGRLSSIEPNLQNIPVRTPLGREIRRAFKAAEGHILIDADYSQIELRILAHLADDEIMRDAFIKNQDIHSRTAAEVFSVPLADVSPEQRDAAKAVNFGIVYGISDFGLSRNLGISRKLAKEYIDGYLSKYTGVKRYMKEIVEKGRADGYVATLMGRRRPLPELKSPNYNVRSFGERIALNMPVQGTAADMIKLAMIETARRLEDGGFSARLILQVHDELIVEAPKAEEAKVTSILRECMEGVMKLSVPIEVHIKSGISWYDTK